MPSNTPNLGPGGGPNAPFGQIAPTYFGEVSGSTDQSVAPSLNFSSEASLGFLRSAASTVALSYGTFIVTGGPTLAPNTVGGLSLATYSFSITTATSATVIPDAHLGLVFRASGISLVYVSGGTVYSFGSSGVGSSFQSGTA